MKKLFTILLITFICAEISMAQDLFKYKLGSFEVVLLPEIQQQGSKDILIGATPQMLEELVPDGTFPNAVNAFLIKMRRKNILVDAGYGMKLLENIEAAGLTPDKIDILLLTHLHGDHIGGMLRDGAPTFPNAEIYISQIEYDYWMSDEEMLKVPEDKRGGFMNVRNILKAYPKNVYLFTPNALDENFASIYLGIMTFEAYGHTPGHTAYQIESGGEKLMIWGDVTHAMAVQMPYPDVAVTYDVNPEQAIKSRKKILEYVAKNNIPIAGMHIAYPGMGRISVNPSGGYIFEPMGE